MSFHFALYLSSFTSTANHAGRTQPQAIVCALSDVIMARTTIKIRRCNFIGWSFFVLKIQILKYFWFCAFQLSDIHAVHISTPGPV